MKIIRAASNHMKRMMNKLFNSVNIKLSGVVCTKGITINGRIKLINNGSIKIGEGVRINSGKEYNVIGGDVRTNLITIERGEIVIGNHVGLSNSTIVARQSVVIGNNVLIGGSCALYDNDFHPVNPGMRLNDPNTGINTMPIVIEDNVFIGAHTIILKGVHIGENSVIGAGSVVTKDVPNNEVWAGNPACKIKVVD